MSGTEAIVAHAEAGAMARAVTHAETRAGSRAGALARTTRRHRVMVLAREEYRRALETRWLYAFAAVFAAFVLGLSYFGLAQSREIGFTDLARVTLSLLNLVLFIVPLTGLVLGVSSVAASGESLALLLAQPVSRGEVLCGKFLGLGAAMTAAEALGFGGGGVVVALGAGGAGVPGFAALCLASVTLGWLTIAVALCLAALWPDRLKALSAALVLWLVMVVAYDLAVLGATALLDGLPLRSVLLPALLLNPVDLARVLVTLAVGSGALFGPTSAVLVHTLGSRAGLAAGAGALALQTCLPLVVAWVAFRRRDW